MNNKCRLCNNTFKPKDITFSVLLNCYDKILIPKIQRDYAQGRDDPKANAVRERLLDDIFSTFQIESENNKIKFDFIFGTEVTQIDGDKTERCFVPFDGQQRLTTLFLLYLYRSWFFLGDQEKELANKELKKFSYDTREASRNFCVLLTGTDGNGKYKLVIVPDELKGKKLSEYICNQTKFLDYWKNDPTVDAMLRMLDAIHKKAQEATTFPKLDNITFQFFDMDEHRLTDSLYLRMNARGKPLTAFENLKADIENWMSGKVEQKFLDHWKSAIDGHWLNWFWKNNKINNSTTSPAALVDGAFLRSIANILAVYYVHAKKDMSDGIFTKLHDIKGDEAYIPWSYFKAVLDIDDAIKFLNNALNFMCCEENADKDAYASCEALLRPVWMTTDESPLTDLVKNYEYKPLLAFYAFCLSKNIKWKRVIWNILENSEITVKTMLSTIGLIDELSENSNQIITFLANDNSQIQSDVSKKQIAEECIKAKLFIIDSWETEIIKAEAHPVFRGNIRVLLKDNENTELEHFKQLRDTAKLIFDDPSVNSYLWIRAMLAKSDLTFEECPQSINLSNNTVDNRRTLFNSDIFITAFRNLLSELVETLNVTKKMKEICDGYNAQAESLWLEPLVKWEGEDGKTLLANYSETKKIQKYNNYGRDGYDIYLYNKNNWTECNLLLSSWRNKIVSSLLKSEKFSFSPSSDCCNIQDKFFRGWNITLKRQEKRKNKTIEFEYLFERQFLNIGIHKIEELDEYFVNVCFPQNTAKEGRLYQRVYDYRAMVTNDIELVDFVKQIEVDVLDVIKLLQDAIATSP